MGFGDGDRDRRDGTFSCHRRRSHNCGTGANGCAAVAAAHDAPPGVVSILVREGEGQVGLYVRGLPFVVWLAWVRRLHTTVALLGRLRRGCVKSWLVGCGAGGRDRWGCASCLSKANSAISAPSVSWPARAASGASAAAAAAAAQRLFSSPAGGTSRRLPRSDCRSHTQSRLPNCNRWREHRCSS